jgi:uncharacterized protein
MRWKNALIVILLFSLISMVFVSFSLYEVVKHQHTTIEDLKGEIKGVTAVKELEVNPNLTSGRIVAVKSTDGLGVLGDVSIEIKDGDGRILMNTNPFVEPDTQYSVNTAIKVASAFTNTNLLKKDIIVSFNTTGTVIGGPSAGAAISTAAIAAIEGRDVRSDVVITGTISPSGEIGPVSGIFEKAEAAADEGMKLFLVPKDQSKVRFYEKVIEEEKIGIVTIERVHYLPKEIDLKEYMRERGMEVEEVSKIGDAVQYLLE